MNSKTIVRRLVAVAAFAGLVSAVNVGVTFAASATAPTTATVIAAMTITNTADLAFGSLWADAAGGTLQLAANATADLTPAATVHPMTSAHTAARFTVGGEPSTAYTITVPGSVTLTRQSGSETMSVATFTTSLSSGATINAGSTTLPVGGSDTLYVGGTLTVGASQVAGNYTGSLQVDVNYN